MVKRKDFNATLKQLTDCLERMCSGSPSFSLPYPPAPSSLSAPLLLFYALYLLCCHAFCCPLISFYVTLVSDAIGQNPLHQFPRSKSTTQQVCNINDKSVDKLARAYSVVSVVSCRFPNCVTARPRPLFRPSKRVGLSHCRTSRHSNSLLCSFID